MEPNIKRSKIPCWFETQPNGCLKPHCVFLHSKSRPSFSEYQSKSSEIILPTTKITVKQVEPVKSEPIVATVSQKSQHINISIERDEESDDQENNETPLLINNEVEVKTLEQIRMEKILNSSEEITSPEFIAKTNGFKPSENRAYKKQHKNSISTEASPTPQQKNSITVQTKSEIENENIVVKTLDQIRKEREDPISNIEEIEPNKSVHTSKENQTPNLLKRSLDDNKQNSTSRPIKLKRHRFNDVQLKQTSNNSAEIQILKNEKCEKNESSSLCELENDDKLKSNFDFDEFALLEMDSDHSINVNNSVDICVNFEDDELMREIDQVINS